MFSITSVEIDKLMERMYRLWNIRPRSEKEVRDYFRIKNQGLKILGKAGISDLAIELVIKKLKQKQLINDEEFAKAWVESRRRKKGPRVLKQELFQKGIDREIIEELMGEQNTKYSQEIAEKLLERKIKAWKVLSRLEFKKKAYGFLLRRGFEYDMIKNVVENVEKRC